MNKQIDILISDLDGTLLNEQKHVDTKDAHAIQKWIACGKRFWVASGRGFDCRKLLNADGVYPEYIIGSTGSTIHDRYDHCIYQYQDHIHDLDQIIHDLTKLRCGFMLDHVHGDAIDLFHRYGHDPYHLVSEHIHQRLDDMIDTDTLDLNHVDVLKIFVVFEDDPMALTTQHHLLSSYAIMAYHGDTNCLEIVPKGCSKYHALAYLCDHLHIDISTVAAIGDEENDIDMIRHAGYGYVMAHSRDEVKVHADHIVDSVGDAIIDLMES